MDVAQILQTFGFTEVEARVYLQLCACAPATGYELAKALKSSRANVYTALENLVAKGAAEKTLSAPVKYAPVHPEDLVARLGARTTAALDALRRDLPRPTQAQPDDFWVIVGPDPIMEKAVELICSARRTLVASLWPEEYMALAPALEASRIGGVQVTVITAGPEENGVTEARRMTLVADGARLLTGTPDGRALYTSEPALVALADRGLYHEVLVLELRERGEG